MPRPAPPRRRPGRRHPAVSGVWLRGGARSRRRRRSSVLLFGHLHTERPGWLGQPGLRYTHVSDTALYRNSLIPSRGGAVSTLLYALGRWSYRHPWRVLVSWLLLLGIAGGGALAFNQGTDNSFTIPGTEAQAGL